MAEPMDVDVEPRGIKRTAEGVPIVTAPRRIKVSLYNIALNES